MPLNEHDAKSDKHERQSWTADSTLMLLANRIGSSSAEISGEDVPPSWPGDERAKETDPKPSLKGSTEGESSAPVAKPQAFPRWRVFKITGAGLMLAAGLYAMLLPHLAVTSDTAVVSAYLTSIRVPIEGVLNSSALTPGLSLEKGAAVGSVQNSRAADQRLLDLAAMRVNSADSAQAIHAQLTELAAQKQSLLARLADSKAALLSRLEYERQEAQMNSDAKSAAAEGAALELNRANTLRNGGIITQAELDKKRLENQLAMREQQQSRAKLAAVEAEKTAAEKGLLNERGETADVPYSAQRIDEISIQMTELRRLEAVSLLQAQRLSSFELQESDHAGLMRQANLLAPETGTIWKLHAVPGEHLKQGDTVADLIDASQAFILASVPQERVADINMGARARFKLSGEQKELTGEVVSIGGDAFDPNRKLAAVPNMKIDQSVALVRIRPDMPIQKQSDIGRTARVLITARGKSSLSGWVSTLF
jgi:multidrug resistance efflux pump